MRVHLLIGIATLAVACGACSIGNPPTPDEPQTQPTSMPTRSAPTTTEPGEPAVINVSITSSLVFFEGAAGVVQSRLPLGGEVLDVDIAPTGVEGDLRYSFGPLLLAPGEYWIQLGLASCPERGCDEEARVELLDKAASGSGIINLANPRPCDFDITVGPGETVNLNATFGSKSACEP